MPMHRNRRATNSVRLHKQIKFNRTVYYFHGMHVYILKKHSMSLHMCCYTYIYTPAHHMHSHKAKNGVQCEHISTTSTSGVIACDTLLCGMVCTRFYAHTFNALTALSAPGYFCSFNLQTMTLFLSTEDRLQMPSFQTWRFKQCCKTLT